MTVKKINAIVWLVKAAELDVVRRCCVTRLAGLYFDLIYTLPYAMCLNTVSEIISTLDIEQDQNIIATSRFSSVNLISPAEMALLQQRVAGFVRDTTVTADVWQEVAPDYVALAVEKARASMARTMMELSHRGRGSFTLLAVNNDRLPVLELLALSLNPAVRIPREGEVMEMRFEGLADSSDGQARLLYAAHGAVV